MLLTAQPIFDAVESVRRTKQDKPRIILMCPQGERFTQAKAEELAKEEHLIFICGHYEGFDERIREYLVTDELSLGDYVLTGGELAAWVWHEGQGRCYRSITSRRFRKAGIARE